MTGWSNDNEMRNLTFADTNFPEVTLWQPHTQALFSYENVISFLIQCLMYVQISCRLNERAGVLGLAAPPVSSVISCIIYVTIIRFLRARSMGTRLAMPGVLTLIKLYSLRYLLSERGRALKTLV